MIQIGIHTDNWRPLSQSFETACQKIAALGVRHIEFAVIHGQNFIQALGYDPGVSLQANPRALRKYLEKLGLEVTPDRRLLPDDGPQRLGLRRAIRAADRSASRPKWAARWSIRSTGPSRRRACRVEEVFRVTCDNYRQCLSWAEDYGVIINVETHGPYTSNLEFMTRLFEHFDSPYLRFNFDTGNTFIAGKDPLEFCKALRKYLSHCHIKDVSPALAAAVRGEETGIGSSEVPVGGGVNAENIKAVIRYLQGNRLGRRRLDRVPRLRREHPQEPGVHAADRGRLIQMFAQPVAELDVDPPGVGDGLGGEGRAGMYGAGPNSGVMMNSSSPSARRAGRICRHSPTCRSRARCHSGAKGCGTCGPSAKPTRAWM